MKIWASTTLAAAAALAATPTSYAFTQSLGIAARPSSVSSISASTSQLSKQSAATATSSSTSLAAEGSDESFPTADTDLSDVGFVLLAGGTGSRMKANMPKQYLTLRGMPVLHHSLDLFLERLPVFARENGKRYVMCCCDNVCYMNSHRLQNCEFILGITIFFFWVLIAIICVMTLRSKPLRNDRLLPWCHMSTVDHQWLSS